MFKYFPLILLLAQSTLATPTPDGAVAVQLKDMTQSQLEQEAHNETINLLNALFRAQISYFSGVRAKLAPSTKRGGEIAMYVMRLNEAIAEKELDKKNAMWLSIFEQFNKSKLLVNNQVETGLSDEDYQALLTDKKLQDISKSFVRDVSAYFWKMAQFSGKVFEMSFDEYIENEKKQLQ